MKWVSSSSSSVHKFLNEFEIRLTTNPLSRCQFLTRSAFCTIAMNSISFTLHIPIPIPMRWIIILLASSKRTQCYSCLLCMHKQNSCGELSNQRAKTLMRRSMHRCHKLSTIKCYHSIDIFGWTLSLYLFPKAIWTICGFEQMLRAALGCRSHIFGTSTILHIPNVTWIPITHPFATRTILGCLDFFKAWHEHSSLSTMEISMQLNDSTEMRPIRSINYCLDNKSYRIRF